MILLKINELKLGDTVELFDGPWGYGIVNKIENDIIHIFRPYGTCADFSYTGGVIPYVGFEDVEYSLSNPHLMCKVHERRELR